MSEAIAIGGLGNGIVDLTYVPWLADRALWYWGDLDVEGFEILSRLRIRFPQTRSFLMDASTVHRWKDSLAVPGSNASTVCSATPDRGGNDRIQSVRCRQPANRTGTNSAGGGD